MAVRQSSGNGGGIGQSTPLKKGQKVILEHANGAEGKYVVVGMLNEKVSDEQNKKEFAEFNLGDISEDIEKSIKNRFAPLLNSFEDIGELVNSVAGLVDKAAVTWAFATAFIPKGSAGSGGGSDGGPDGGTGNNPSTSVPVLPGSAGGTSNGGAPKNDLCTVYFVPPPPTPKPPNTGSGSGGGSSSGPSYGALLDKINISTLTNTWTPIKGYSIPGRTDAVVLRKDAQGRNFCKILARK